MDYRHAVILFLKCSCLIALFCLLSCNVQAQVIGSSGASGQAAGGKGAGGTKAQNPDAVHDVVTNTFKSRNACIAKDGSKQDSYDVSQDLATLAAGKELDWSSGGLHALLSYYYDALSNPDPHAAYIFHVVKWMRQPQDPTHPDQDDQSADNPPYILVSSDWYVYEIIGSNKLKQTGFKGTGDPLIYGKKRAITIAIDTFSPGKKGNLVSTYNTSVTEGTPENRQDLGQLVGALLGVSGAQAQAQAGTQVTTCGLFVGARVQEGTKKLPFDLTVAVATTDATGNKSNNQSSNQNASPGTANCSGDSNSTPCAMTRTFTSVDREWWDVSIGVTIPGVRESQYSIVSSALQISATRHVDLYGMFDFFPAAAYLPKESWFPHVNVGLPVTSKSLYRPYIGLSENLTGWTHFQKDLGLPVAMNFFAGVVWMKTQVVNDNPTTSAQLTMDTSNKRVWKAVFGIEVPVSSIASKIGKGSKSSSGGGKSSGGG